MASQYESEKVENILGQNGLNGLQMRYNNPAARGILGKMSAPSDSKNCPRTVDCAAVEVRGQFLESRGRTFFPVCRVLPGYYIIITRELRFLQTGPVL